MKTTYNCPTTKLATFLFKAMRLSQASLELSSSRGVFGSLENERKRIEKRENQTLNESCGKKIKLHKNSFKSPLGYKMGGGGGGGGLI